MSEEVISDKKEKQNVSISEVTASGIVKTGIAATAIGIMIGWFAKKSYDEGKMDDVMKDCGFNRQKKD